MRPLKAPEGRPWLAAATAIVVLGALSGCSAGGGQDVEEASQTLVDIPGVKDARVEVNSRLSGLATETSVSASLTIDDGFRLEDAETLVSFLIATAWSANDKQPNNVLSIRLTLPKDDQLDAFAAAQEAGWPGVFGSGQRAQGRFLLQVDSTKIGGPEALERLGDWPGDVPTLPDGVIVAVD